MVPRGRHSRTCRPNVHVWHRGHHSTSTEVPIIVPLFVRPDFQRGTIIRKLRPKSMFSSSQSDRAVRRGRPGVNVGQQVRECRPRAWFVRATGLASHPGCSLRRPLCASAARSKSGTPSPALTTVWIFIQGGCRTRVAGAAGCSLFQALFVVVGGSAGRPGLSVVE